MIHNYGPNFTSNTYAYGKHGNINDTTYSNVSSKLILIKPNPAQVQHPDRRETVNMTIRLKWSSIYAFIQCIYVVDGSSCLRQRA